MGLGTRVRKSIATMIACVAVTFADTAESEELTSFAYKTVDQKPIYADVSIPKGSGSHPAILFFHGGALIQGSREWILPWQRQLYVDAGFVFVSIDYRLAPETKLPEILSDIEDAYLWLRNVGPGLFDVDPESISVLGNSAGGYLALTSGYRFTPRPRAIVSFYGYGDVTGDWYTEPSEEFLGDGEIPETDARAAVGTTVITGTPFDMAHRRGDF
jgi:acetyl esterase/lipase